MIKLPRTMGEGHMTDGPDEIALWQDVKKITFFTKMLEIGTNAGHSSALVLDLFPDVTIHSIDIFRWDITLDAVNALKKEYKDRFEYLRGDSTTCSYLTNYYTLAFVDGSHDYPDVMEDISNVRRAKIPYLLMDDYNYKGVSQACEHSKLELIKKWSYNNHWGETEIGLFIS